MGCNGSKERQPQQVSTQAYQPSSQGGGAPRKAVCATTTTTTNGAASVATGCVANGIDPQECATTSTSPATRTPARSHRSCASPTSLQDDVFLHNEGEKDATQGRAAEAAPSPPSSSSPHQHVGAGAAAPTCVGDADNRPSRCSSSTLGLQAPSAHLSQLPPAEAEATPSLASCVSTPAVCTPTTTSPPWHVHTSTVPASLLNAERSTPLLLLPPAPHTTSEAAATVGPSSASLHHHESTMLFEGEDGRGELGGTAATLMNSSSLLQTFASTQPPSVQASRSASAQPAVNVTTTSFAKEHAMAAASAATPASQAPTSDQATTAGLVKEETSTRSARSPNRPASDRFHSSPGEEVLAAPAGGCSPATLRGSPRRVGNTAEATRDVRSATPPSTPTAQAATSDECGAIVDGCRPASVQTPATMRVRESDGVRKPSLSTSPLPKSQRRRHEPSTAHSRCASVPAASPRPRTPVMLMSPHRLGTPSSAPLATAPLSAAAMISGDRDAPEDVPRPIMDDFFNISPLCSSIGHTHGGGGGGGSGNGGVLLMGSSTAVTGSGLPSPPPPRQGSPGLNDNNNNSTILRSAASPSSRSPCLTSPFTAHLSSHSNSLMVYSTNDNSGGGGAVAGTANGTVSWLAYGNMESSGASTSACNAGTAASSIGVHGGTACGSASSFPPGTPPTNSELVRQINQPATNIKSILRKRAGSAAAAATAAAHHAAAAMDGEWTATSMGLSGAHSRVLSLSLTNLAGSASSPHQSGGDSRDMREAASLPDVAVRTDFITSRQSNSDVEMPSPLGPYLSATSPSPRGCARPQSPPSALGRQGDSANSQHFSLLAEASLSAMGTSTGNSTSTAAAAAGAARRSPSSRPASHPSLAALGSTPPRSPASWSGGRRSAQGIPADEPPRVALDAPPVVAYIRTSDAPPPDIMLASPRKHVHVVV